MVTKIQDGLVTYIGFHANKNKKFIVETKGNWTYINYQKDEFTRIICGYVVKQTIFYKGIMPSETGFRFSSGL